MTPHPYDRDEKVEAAVQALREALLPNRDAIERSIKDLAEWVPRGERYGKMFEMLDKWHGVGMYTPAVHKCTRKPKYATSTRECKAAGCEPGDDEAPFLSEAFLYNLLGKEDARMLRALVHALLEAIGYDRLTQREKFHL